MGTSSEALLFYGLPFFSKEHSLGEDMSEELYEHLRNLVDGDCDPGVKEGTQAGEVAIGWSGDLTNLDVGTWSHVYIIGSDMMGYDYPTEFDPANMLTSDVPHWRERLKTFCEANGIPWQEPGWHLTVQRG
jgi:hypothetical protein